jgi:hypothetical protein
VRWFSRLFALPFLAAGFYFLWNVALGLQYDIVGLNRFSEDWSGLLVGFGFGLAIAIPGLVLATFTYFVVVNESHREIVVTMAFGPLKVRSSRELGDYHIISIVDDGDTDATMSNVNLCGEKGTRPITLMSFTKRDEANEFANELGRTLALPARDYVGTEADDDDADSVS